MITKFFAILSIIAALQTADAAQKEIILLGTANTVTFRGEVNLGTVLEAQEQLIKLAINRGRAEYPIYLVIDSPGGSITDGLDFIRFAGAIRDIKTVTIFAASMASAIVEALPGERLMVENSALMFHRARGGVDGQFEDGELESRLIMIKRMVRRMEQVNADRLKLSLKDYKEKVKDELWMDENEALEQNGADRIVVLTCTPALINQSTIVSENIAGLFTINFKFSACPLMRSGKVQERK